MEKNEVKLEYADKEYQEKVINYAREYMHYNIPIELAVGSFPSNTFVPPSVVNNCLNNIRLLWNHTETSERLLNEWIDELEKHKIERAKKIAEEHVRIMNVIKRNDFSHEM